MLNKYKNFCPVPWTQFATSTIGEQRMCCAMDFEKPNVLHHGKFIYKDGKKLTVKNSIAEYTNSDSVKIIKDELINNKQPSTCMCYADESIRNTSDNFEHTSKRISVLNKFNIHTDEDVEKFLDKKNNIDYFDIRLGNDCNLQCLMCAPIFSNQLYEQALFTNNFNDTYIGKDFLISKKNNKIVFDLKKEEELYGWANQSFFVDLEKKVIDQLNQDPDQHITFYFLGGEPLLNKPHLEFLKRLYDKGYSKLIQLEYNTNMTVSNDNLLDLWSNFRKVILALSIDDTGDRYEYIRYPAKWSKIIDNLSTLKQYMLKTPDIYDTVNFVSIYNLFTVDNFTNTESIAKSMNIGCGPIISWGPSYTTPAVLTFHEKKEYLEYIPQDHNYDRIANYIMHFEFNHEARNDFFNLLKFWDSKRRKPFKDVFINLAKVLKI